MNDSFLDRHAHLTSLVHALNPQVKIVLVAAFAILVVSTPAHAGPAFAAYAVLLGGILLLSRLPLGYFFSRLAVVLPFVAMFALFIPFLPEQHLAGAAGMELSRWTVFWTTLVKALLGAGSTILLTATTPFPKLLQAMGHLRAPQLLVLILSFAYRYIFVLVDEARRMKRACDARGYAGRWLGQARVFGHLIGTLFLRSYERGERVYLAMLARGFDGRFRRDHDCRVRRADIAGGVCAGAVILSIRFLIA